MNILVLILVGLLVGVLAQVMMGGGLGWIMSIILGVVGVFLGGWLFAQFGIGGGGLLFQVIAGLAGACLILFLGRLLFKKKRRR